MRNSDTFRLYLHLQLCTRFFPWDYPDKFLYDMQMQSGMHVQSGSCVPVRTMDFFTLPYNDLFVIYSPLKKLAFLVNKTVIQNLKSRLTEKEPREISQNNQHILDFLEDAGIFETAELAVSKSNTDNFFPTSTTLFLSNQCNLRCIYCYASAGERSPVYMPWKIAKAAVDFIIKNAVAIHEKNVQIGFHGGGEPMLSWRLMKQIVEYFVHSATKSGLHPSVHSATNGLLSPMRLKWVIDNFTSLNISLDGLP
jgi:uncharacterized protein